MKKICLFLVLSYFVVAITNAQTSTTPYFKKGDRVCFVGNSITHNGEFHHNILQFFVTRYPTIPISFFNAGIKGDVTGGILKRIETDVLLHKPSHVVIMIGMNDVQRELYGKNPSQNADTLAKRKAALDVYAKNLDSIVRFFIQKKIKVILQKPSAYDQTSAIKYPNNLGVNDALITCGSTMQQLANKFKLPIVDYNTIMTNIALQQQAKTTNFTLTVNDRVHPNSVGHFIMAYQFLSTFNKDSIVSKLVFDTKNLLNKAENKNCLVSNASFKNNTVQFSLLENALPFPIADNQQQALNLVPFTKDLNNQIVQVNNLPKGSYQLKIDSIVIDNFSSDDLQKGVNLALYKKTPQYQQALVVKKALEKLWDNEATFRAVVFTEFTCLQNFAEKNNLEATKKYLSNLLVTKFNNQAYYANAFEKYGTYKNQLSEVLKQADSLRNVVYTIAKPTVHQYTIKKNEEPTVASLIEASQSGAMPLLFEVQPNFLVKEQSDFKSDKEFFVRNGLPNFFKKINQPNASLTIGFLGGSITKAEDQYRNQTLAFLQSLHPAAKLKGINAGVSGTGTELAACRVGSQILQYNPDLVFVEFAVNGGSNQALEGIVRQIKKHHPQTDICFIYTIAGEQFKQYAKNEVPGRIQAFEKVAAYYNIPSIHMGLYPSVLEAEGKLVWKSATAVDNKIVFSKDGTHPAKAGGDLYAQSIARAFNQFKEFKDVKPFAMPLPMHPDNWEDGKMLSPIEIGVFTNGWEQVNPLNQPNLKAFAPWFSTVAKTAEANASFTFKFKGTAFGFFDIGGPEVGQVLVEVDGKCAELTKKAGNVSNKVVSETDIKCLVNRFNSNCNNRYRGQFEMFEVTDGEHEVKITLSNIKADKLAILQGQNLDDIQSNPAKYNQQIFYLGKILLKGVPLKN
ncbi:MAG: GDSL-type esterase/lipase family protein [Chitinophagaceae bacterium]